MLESREHNVYATVSSSMFLAKTPPSKLETAKVLNIPRPIINVCSITELPQNLTESSKTSKPTKHEYQIYSNLNHEIYLQ